MITSDSFQHDEEHRRLSGGGWIYIPLSPFRFITNGALNAGLTLDYQIAGANGVPGDAKGIICMLYGTGAAATNQLAFINPDDPSNNQSARIICQVSGQVIAGNVTVGLSHNGTVRLWALQGNWTSIFADIIAWIGPHPN